MKNRTNIISFSGGKDSTALILWAKENLECFETIFCDTGWEHEITYAYIEYINKELLDGKLIYLKSEKYDGFADMCIQKKRAPSVRARFCTHELKLKPSYKYIHEVHSGHVELYVGIRKDESPARAKMPYRNFDLDYYGCWINRPLIDWTAEDVFNIMAKYNIEPNPLYKMGMKRVGCMPCVLSGHKEILEIAKRFPEVIQEIREIEEKTGRTFFSPDKIPEAYRKDFDESTSTKIAFIDNVVEYVSKDPQQQEFFEPLTCMSYYNICE